MHETQAKILELLKDSNKPLSTKDLLMQLEPEYKELISRVANENDRRVVNEYKREIAKFHRRLLHHLNQLVIAGLIRESSYGEKGLKYYELNLSFNEIVEISRKFKGSIIKKTIALEKPKFLVPFEGYEEKGILLRYSSGDFIERINSLYLFANNFALEDLAKNLVNYISLVNDAVCIGNFEYMINYYDKSSILNLIAKAKDMAKEYGKVINLIVNLESLEKKAIIDYVKYSSENLVFIFNVHNSNIFDYAQILESVIEVLASLKGTLFIKNNEIKRAPYFIGKAGVYSFDEEDFKKINREKTNLLACGQSTIILDVNKYISEYSINPKNFYDFILKVVKSLSLSNFLQRKNFSFLFRNIDASKEFMLAARNYVRFWNYNLAKKEERDFIFDLINNSKQLAKEFAHNQETIYKSCGMPINFKIAFSCAFRQAHEALSEMAYERIELRSSADLENKEIKEELKARERLCRALDCNRVSLYKKGNNSAIDTIKEIYDIFRNYKIEFLGYNFKEAKKDMKLDWFIK